MAKHSDADDKLTAARKLRQQIRSRQQALRHESEKSINRTPANLSIKGTNANNQFR